MKMAMVFSNGLWSELDWADRANCVWSVLLLSVLAVATGLLRVLGPAFVCWTPAEFMPQHNLYTSSVTALTGHFYHVRSLSSDPGAVAAEFTSHHQAAPLLLLLQALAFLSPFLLWRLARPLLAPILLVPGAKTPEDMVPFLAKVMLSSLRGAPSRLAIGYVAVKVLACLNILTQFVILTAFFWPRLNILRHHEGNLLFFPTKILVDYQIVQHTNVHQYTSQCLSPLNDVIIRLFVFLWYWLLFLGCVTVLQTLVTAASLMVPVIRDSQLEVFVLSACWDQQKVVNSRGQKEGSGAGQKVGQEERAGASHEAEQGPGRDGARAGAGLESRAPQADQQRAVPDPGPGDVRGWVSGTLGMDGALLLSWICSCQGAMTAALVTREMWRLAAPAQAAMSSPPDTGDVLPEGQKSPLTVTIEKEEGDANGGRVQNVAV